MIVQLWGLISEFVAQCVPKRCVLSVVPMTEPVFGTTYFGEQSKVPNFFGVVLPPRRGFEFHQDAARPRWFFAGSDGASSPLSVEVARLGEVVGHALAGQAGPARPSLRWPRVRRTTWPVPSAEVRPPDLSTTEGYGTRSRPWPPPGIRPDTGGQRGQPSPEPSAAALGDESMVC